MKKKYVWIPLTVILLVFGSLLFVGTSRTGYETAEYKVVTKEGEFEIRQYKPHKVVTTPMKSNDEGASFGRLFQYISGKNNSERKIAMTTPVFMPTSNEGELQEMQFVIPAEVANSGAPIPSSPEVKVKAMSGGRYAAIRFNGRETEILRKEKLKELEAELTKRKIKSTGKPIFAGYDPPWTPGPMRRNEVLLKVDS